MLEKLAALRATHAKIARSRQRLRAEIATREKEDNKALAVAIGITLMANRMNPVICAGLDAVVRGSMLKPEHLAMLKELLGETDAGHPTEVATLRPDKK
jgi:hypothetical protein